MLLEFSGFLPRSVGRQFFCEHSIKMTQSNVSFTRYASVFHLARSVLRVDVIVRGGQLETQNSVVCAIHYRAKSTTCAGGIHSLHPSVDQVSSFQPSEWFFRPRFLARKLGKERFHTCLHFVLSLAQTYAPRVQELCTSTLFQNRAIRLPLCLCFALLRFLGPKLLLFLVLWKRNGDKSTIEGKNSA